MNRLELLRFEKFSFRFSLREEGGRTFDEFVEDYGAGCDPGREDGEGIIVASRIIKIESIYPY